MKIENEEVVYKCKGCEKDIIESDGDHLFNCDGEGWSK